MITAIDTVRAYHSGPRMIVEVDVVMDPRESLRSTHDVAEELQTKLESLPNVERAYVHIDYETSHKPEHFVKKELWGLAWVEYVRGRMDIQAVEVIGLTGCFGGMSTCNTQ